MGRIELSVLLCMIAALGCDPVDSIDSCLDLGGSYDYQFAQCDREHDHPGPESACLRGLPGSWVVAGHLAPGVSAMSEAEASSWGGSILSLSRNGLTFRSHVCSSASFETREIPRSEFEESFRIRWDALGLGSASVCVTEVSCADGSPRPGSLLLHGRDELLALWDGVYFRLRRQ